MEYKDRLKAARKHAGLTQGQLAEAIGITQTSISDLERGKSKGSTYSARIAQACGISALWLEDAIGEMLGETSHTNITPMLQPHRGPKEYPLISWISAGERCESAPCCATPEAAEDWLPSTENAGEYGYWLKVKGKSMTSDSQPSFPEGTPILIRPEGFDILSGKFYIARHTSGETTFKQYIQDAGIGYLVPLNPKYQTVTMDGTWEIIGRAIDAKITGL